MKKYIEPTLEIVTFDSTSIITVSVVNENPLLIDNLTGIDSTGFGSLSS